MRRKMFIKNIVYKKWYIVFCAYIVFCVYAIFIILCKKNTNLSQRPKFFESQNFLHFFILFLFQSACKAQKILFFNKFQSALIKNQANTTQESAKNVKSTKNKKITQNCEQPPNRTAKSAKKRINIDNRTKKC